MNVLPSAASALIVASLFTTIEVKDIPYSVALSPAVIQRQESLVNATAGATQSPFRPQISSYRTSGEAIILGDNGTMVYLQPRLPSSISELPPAAIERVELRIPVRQRSASTRNGSVAFGCYRILQSWSQASKSSFTQPATASSPLDSDNLSYQALGVPVKTPAGSSMSAESVLISPTVTGGTQQLSFDVTSLVRQWLSGSPNYGFAVRETNTSQTTGLWWESPSGSRPELYVTVRQEYLPHQRPATSNPGGAGWTGEQRGSSGGFEGSQGHGGAGGRDTSDLSGASGSVNPVYFAPLPIDFSVGGSLVIASSTTNVGADDPEMLEASGVAFEGKLGIGSFEGIIGGSGAQVNSSVGGSISLQPASGSLSDFRMLGNMVFRLGNRVEIVPGIGLASDQTSLEYGSSSDRIAHKRSFAGLMLGSQLRWQPVSQIELRSGVYAMPFGITNETFRRTQTGSWVQHEASGIIESKIKGEVSASIKLIPNLDLSAAYGAASSYAAAQNANWSYSDSAGNVVPGVTDTPESSTSTRSWRIGALYRF